MQYLDQIVKYLVYIILEDHMLKLNFGDKVWGCKISSSIYYLFIWGEGGTKSLQNIYYI